jgi:hypothetical protein
MLGVEELGAFTQIGAKQVKKKGSGIGSSAWLDGGIAVLVSCGALMG